MVRNGRPGGICRWEPPPHPAQVSRHLGLSGCPSCAEFEVFSALLPPGEGPVLSLAF